MRINEALLAVNHYGTFVPGLSSLIALVDLVAKGVMKAIGHHPKEHEALYYVQEKSIGMVVLALIPLVNVVAAVRNRHLNSARYCELRGYAAKQRATTGTEQAKREALRQSEHFFYRAQYSWSLTPISKRNECQKWR